MENYSSLLRDLMIFQTSSSSLGILIKRLLPSVYSYNLGDWKWKGLIRSSGFPVCQCVIVHYSAVFNSLAIGILCHVQSEAEFISLDQNLVEKSHPVQILLVLFTLTHIKTERFCMFSIQTKSTSSIFYLKQHQNCKKTPQQNKTKQTTPKFEGYSSILHQIDLR